MIRVYVVDAGLRRLTFKEAQSANENAAIDGAMVNQMRHHAPEGSLNSCPFVFL
jgi:hypothetical protein